MFFFRFLFHAKTTEDKTIILGQVNLDVYLQPEDKMNFLILKNLTFLIIKSDLSEILFGYPSLKEFKISIFCFKEKPTRVRMGKNHYIMADKIWDKILTNKEEIYGREGESKVIEMTFFGNGHDCWIEYENEFLIIECQNIFETRNFKVNTPVTKLDTAMSVDIVVFLKQNVHILPNTLNIMIQNSPSPETIRVNFNASALKDKSKYSFIVRFGSSFL